MKTDFEKAFSEQDILLSLDKALSNYSRKSLVKFDVLDNIDNFSSKKSSINELVQVEGDILEEEGFSLENKKPIKTLKAKIGRKQNVKEKSEKKVKLKVAKNKTKSKKTKKSKISRFFLIPKLSKSVKNLSKPHFLNFPNYKKHLFATALVFFMIGFATLSTYVAYAYVAAKTNDVLGNVEKHVILPTNETPKVYIIQSEKSEIFQNPLFKGIQIGDNVLSYINAGKVYIYRSSADKIVNIVNTSQ